MVLFLVTVGGHGTYCLVFATGLDWFQTGLDRFHSRIIVQLKPRENDILHLPINSSTK